MAKHRSNSRMSHWFVLKNERVLGPYKEDEVKAQVAGGHLETDCLVWGRSQPNWVAINLWMKDLPQMTASLENKVSLQTWHYAANGVSKGPLSRAELVDEIKALQNKGEIMVWTKGMKAWADLFEFHDLLDEMGINRREHPRSSITGTAVIKFDDQTLIGQLKTISPGGCGISQLNTQLQMGQIVSVEIKSDALGEPIAAKATIQYSTDMGYYGFKFVNTNMEAKARILDYIKNNKGSVAYAA